MPRKKAALESAGLSQLPRGNRIALVLVEVIGLAIAVYLTLIAFRVIYDGQVPCLRSKIFACESVVRGPFSKIGPFSIALMGVLYFLGQLVLTALLDWKRWMGPLKVLSVFVGLLFVAWLRTLELVHMKKICPWCWGVAFTVLVQTALIWPLAPTLLPPMRLHGRLAGALLFLFAFVGVTSAVEEIFKPSKSGTIRFFGYNPPREEDEDSDEEESAASASAEAQQSGGDRRQTAKNESRSDRSKARPKPTKTPVAVAQASPRETPGRSSTATIREVSNPAPAPPTPTPTPVEVRPTQAPAPSPGALGPEPPIDLPEVPELQLLQQRGWRMVASTERVEELIRSAGPVLLMVYDPFCEECHATMRKGLSTDEVDQLPVTRVAIDQGSLTGKISEQVSHVPTILLIDGKGFVKFKHTGRIGSAKLVDEVVQALQK